MFNPLFSFMGGMGSIKLLYPIALLIIAMRISGVKHIFSIFNKELRIFILLLLYSFLTIIVGGESVEAYKHIVLIIESFAIPLIIMEFIVWGNRNRKVDFLQLFLITGTVAALISTACIVNPQIHNFMKFDVQFVNAESFFGYSAYRGFGLAETLTYSYGVIQGILLGLGILNIRRYKWFAITIPFFIASIILNARTGLVVAVSSLVCYVFFNFNKFKSWGSLVIGGCVAFVIMSYLLNAYGFNDDQMYFIRDFFDQLTEVEEVGLQGGDGAIGALTTSHLVWPEGGEWVFGKGYIIMGRAGGHNSDVGFIQQLNYGGLIYIIILLSILVCMFRRLRNLNVSKDIVLFLMITFAIANFKGNFMMMGGGFRLFMILYFSFVYSSYLNRINLNEHFIHRSV